MMTDSEDYRVKAAREGKAIYIPGKDIREIEAERAKAKAKASENAPRVIELTNADWSEIDRALPDVMEVLTDVQNVFSLLAWAEDLDRIEVRSVLRMSCRAVQSMEDKEIMALDRLDTAVRRAGKGGR